MSQLDWTYVEEFTEGVKLEIDLRVNYRFWPGRPAQPCGPVERCSPLIDDQIEITSIACRGAVLRHRHSGEEQRLVTAIESLPRSQEASDAPQRIFGVSCAWLAKAMVQRWQYEGDPGELEEACLADARRAEAEAFEA